MISADTKTRLDVDKVKVTFMEAKISFTDK